MDEVTFNGMPLSALPTSTPPDDNSVWPGDRELLELLRGREFAEAKRRFKGAYNNAHVAFLCGFTGQSIPSDDQGPLRPLTEAEFLAAVGYLEGATKH